MTHKTTLAQRAAPFAAALLVAVAAFAGALINVAPAAAQTGACTSLADTNGKATGSITPTQTDVYTIWSRVKSADGAPSYTFSIDGACDTAVSTTGSGTGWVWVKHSKTASLAAGTAYQVQMAGNKDGTGLDCVIFVVDETFVPGNSASECDPVAFPTVTPTPSPTPEPTPTPTPTPTQGSPDINNDGAINHSDLAILIGSYYNGGTVAPYTAGDLNGDGQVTHSDLAILIGAYVNGL